MEQEIRFCTTSDNVRIAYATVGEGPPLVKAANWLSHLEYDWDSPVWRHWLREIARRHTLVRYDERGCGLSDWQVDDFSFDSWVRDLETVVDAVGLDRFALMGISQGGAVAIDYATRHPERVSHLILYGAYAQGTARRTLEPDEKEQHQALLTLTRIGWGKDNPAFRQVFSSLFMPEATQEQKEWLTELQRKTTSPENAVKFQEVFGSVDVVDRLPEVKVPTLVLHARNEARVPLEESRRLAAGIPNARFVLLESRNHILLESEPAWQRFMDEVFEFLGTSAKVSSKPFVDDAAPLVQAQPSIEKGQTFAQYKIQEKLGGGGMGVVYKAHDMKLDRAVALKFLPASHSRDEDAKLRFVQEAKAASALDHPNICTIYDIDQTKDGRLFIVMACYEGETLDKKIARGPLPVAGVLDHSRQIASALCAAHDEQIIHRDIKPANIMITKHGAVKLLDFGVAKIIDVNVTRTGTTLGTVGYMSPEQARAEAVDRRTDLWSLGVVLYEMLTGERPFKGEYEQVVLYGIMNEEPQPVGEKRQGVPERLELIVAKLLQKNPDERYQDARELLADFNANLN